MKSTEKVFDALERLQALSDPELAEAIPLGFPPQAARLALAGVAAQLPTDPAELDTFLEGVSEFCLSMRSDEHEPAAA